MVPDIFLFNPTCEPAIANGSPYYTPPARLRQFESDLGYLPAWLAEEKDVVLVQGSVDHEYNQRMKALGFNLPGIVNIEKALSDEKWMGELKGRFLPWGWSPAVYQLVRNLLPSCNEAFRQSPVGEWKQEHKELYSRLTAIELLDKMLQENSHEWLPDRSDLPVVCDSLEGVHEVISNWLDPSAALRDRGIGSVSGRSVVVKMPWSSSGRGLLLFPNPDSAKKNDEVLSGMLSQQRFVTVEPWHEKVVDISYQFEVLSGKVFYKGRTFLENDAKGRYLRNYLTEDIGIQQDVKEFLLEHETEVVSMLERSLSESKYPINYEGWIGVDAIIYRNSQNLLRFHPMLEINGRFTMGAIALRLKRFLDEGSTGFLQIYYSKTVNFQTFCQKRTHENPLLMKEQKISSGFLPLTPPSAGHHFGAYIMADALG